jgi:hypothetical protein
MIKSAFSRVEMVIYFSSRSLQGYWVKGSTIEPLTALPVLLVLVSVRVIISVAVFIVIVDAHNRACKGSSFTEGDEDGLVDLAFRVNLDADMEEGHSAEDYQRGDD